MPFAPTTLDAVMDALSLPVVAPIWVEFTQGALDRVANYGGEPAIARIEEYVVKYQEAEENRNAAAGDAFMTRADVVEWEPGGQVKGFQNEQVYYADKILKALFLPSEQAEIRRMMGGSNRVSNLR
ncbi:hypothetical protein [Leptolyngbya sp. FACHB-16]|uniref:hypothetical protein n=1 Tax=unclassified Leptolyngbya TaxID=2650499 RepID=UPI001688F868|nr:hypothetical protein [Leptolyngbya sp. FACHB-16]MBD2156229.1 hypothetical protein [Leptolyngbya sp. FACHB-16]